MIVAQEVIEQNSFACPSPARYMAGQSPDPALIWGEWVMLRICLLLAGLVLCAGCATEGRKSPFDEALKDLRGDNMQMRSNFAGMTASDYENPKAKIRD